MITPAILAASNRVVAGFRYHRVQMYGSSGYVGLTELAFKVAGSTYYLTSSTVTSPESWNALGGPGNFSIINNGVIPSELIYASVGGSFCTINIITPVPVTVSSLMVATQINYNGTYNVPTEIKYYHSIDGTTWILQADVVNPIPVMHSGFDEVPV